MATDVWADPAPNKGQWILGIPADRLAAVRKLVRVLEGGVLPFPPKEPLVLDSIKATMSCVTFDEWPTRVVGTERRPILRVWGKWYEFARRGGVWVQTQVVVSQPFLGKKILTSNKKLTLRQMRLVRRRLRGVKP